MRVFILFFIFWVGFYSFANAAGVVARRQQMQQQQMAQQQMIQQQMMQQAAQQYLQQKAMVQAAQQQALLQQQAMIVQAVQQKAIAEAVQKQVVMQQVAQYQIKNALENRQHNVQQMQEQLQAEAYKRALTVAVTNALQQKLMAERQMQLAVGQQEYQVAMQKKMLAEKAYQEAIQQKIMMNKQGQNMALQKAVAEKVMGDAQEERYKSYSEKAYSEVEITDIWDELEETSQVWPLMIDLEPKEITVQRQIDLFKQEGATIKKEPYFYVQMLDAMAEQNPDMLQTPFKDLLKIAAVIEYDFDNGQNKDALAKAILGPDNFAKNKQRIDSAKK
ncbi:MAG: hypothetical protein HQL25_07930 [Candidatus Omnitrophica bacterium]|nr:hypothetical protein [Candidatus Omnitrophota bacterium]